MAGDIHQVVECRFDVPRIHGRDIEAGCNLIAKAKLEGARRRLLLEDLHFAGDTDQSIKPGDRSIKNCVERDILELEKVREVGGQ